MNKKSVLFILTFVFLVGLTGCGNGYAKQLQANSWTLSSELDDGIASSARFSEDTMQLKSFGTLEVYAYKN